MLAKMLSNIKMLMLNGINLFSCYLNSEYLATFKKTVAMHEVFLTRIASHPSLRKDSNFKVFLEYKGEVSTTRLYMSWHQRRLAHESIGIMESIGVNEY